MAATITCSKSVKKEIADFLLEKIGEMMEDIREDEDSVTVEETENGLKVEYPIGEIYGYSSDYVKGIAYVFENLKEKYRDIGIYGIAYEYETISDGTFGPLFYCKPEDTKLTVTFEWQECANCGTIVEGDTFYNSSQRDFEEGNLACLCCPTCMLEYALDDGWGDVEPNDSFDDDEQEEIYDNEEDDVLKKFLWKRIADNMDEYLDDFRKNKDKIVALVDNKKLSAEQKTVLLEITDKL